MGSLSFNATEVSCLSVVSGFLGQVPVQRILDSETTVSYLPVRHMDLMGNYSGPKLHLLSSSARHTNSTTTKGPRKRPCTALLACRQGR